MKKLFTIFSLMAAVCLTAAAETEPQAVKLNVYDENNVKVCDTFNAELTYADGVYTIDNFLNSWVPLSFKYDKENKSTEFCGDNFYYPWEDEDDFEYASIWDDFTDDTPEMTFYNFEGEEEAILYWPTFYLPYCGVVVPADTSKRPYLQVYFYAMTDYDDEEAYTDYLSMYMYFNLVEDDSAVEGIAIDNVAPAYYNLQGVRVANPENGLFIKRQGAKAEKVIL